ncbi:acid-sensing ion channel 1C-like [Hydractinia symbiolongicarpus]|uniref:acid-sensing ion channel 1C-like n=1 Tax=Hydractinia symbiolongicarpus TaxID=13093 RepID=UPI002550D85F|nr:acid-sensing ion channel 1C-like [Hydractinia symbiolongicarpus]
MVEYKHLQEEIEFVKNKCKMADNLMNFTDLSNGTCQRNKFAHYSNDTLDDSTDIEITYKTENKLEAIRRKKIKQHANFFIENSTLHGFHYCFDKKHKIRRIIWILLVSASVGFLLEKLYQSTVKFFEFPFSTTTSITYTSEIEFPAISLCNLNDYRTSKMEGKLLHTLLKTEESKRNYSAISGEEYAETTRGANHRLSDMLYSCEIENRQCTYSNFSIFYQTQGERCYTFNTGEKADIIKVGGTGSAKGLDIILNIEHYDYYHDTKDSGMRLIIHDQNETPVRMQGITLTPGFTSFVQTMKKKTTNLPKPYKTACGARPLKYFRHYSKNTCWLERLTDYLVEKCRCKDGFMPGNARVCSIHELQTCAWPNWEKFKHVEDINCPIACEVNYFDTLVSFAQFPSNKFADFIAADFNLTGNTQENRAFVRDNFLRVLIYFEHMSVLQMEQTPSYDLMIFLGDIGGQLGLFLGTSILTYIEFFDVLAMIIYTKYFEIFKAKPRI